MGQVKFILTQRVKLEVQSLSNPLLCDTQYGWYLLTLAEAVATASSPCRTILHLIYRHFIRA